MIRAHEMIVGGELGKLYRVNFIASAWYRTQSYYDSGGWRGTWAGEGGGVIMNQAPHHLDLYCWLGGLPNRVKSTALTRIHEIEVENTVAALLEHGNEHLACLHFRISESSGSFEEALLAPGESPISGPRLPAPGSRLPAPGSRLPAPGPYRDVG